MIKNENIVCLSNYYWGPLKQRYEHIMLELSRHNRVLFIELDADFVRQAGRKLLFKWLKRPAEIYPGFFAATPPPSFPLKYTFPVLNTISQNINAFYYKKLIRKLGFRDFILWVTRPAHFALAGKLGEKLLVYDCVDDHTGFHLVNQPSLVNLQVTNMVKMEKQLLEKAGLVFTSSQELYYAKKNYSNNVYLVPNACDVIHFRKAVAPETLIADRIKAIKQPIIGFIGLLDTSRLDLDLIKRIAFEYKDCYIVLIGPNYLYGEGFSGYKNIHLLGEIRYEEIPNYLKAIDVAIMPYKRNELVRSINPVKLYEYLAAGKPVVCMDYADTAGLEGVIHAARDSNEFISLIKKCLKENSPGLVNKRIEAVKDNTWENRVEMLSGLMEEKLKARSPA